MVGVRAILLDVTLDAPAKALQLQMKQFRCSKCKDKGCQDLIGIGKKGRQRYCHIYPYNTSSSNGHGEVGRHNEIKELALQVLRRKKNGAKSVSKLASDLFISIYCLMLLKEESIQVMCECFFTENKGLLFRYNRLNFFLFCFLLACTHHNYNIQGVLDLFWSFGIPAFHLIRRTAIDYMHCVCEGVVE